MDNPIAAKVAKVDEIAAKLETAGTVVVTEYRGLDVPAQAELRAAVKNAGGEFKIYKNTLTKLAAERTGTALDQHLTGPTALAFAYAPEGGHADPVSLSKALKEFQKTNEALVIKGGVMDGAVIGPDDVTALSKVAPREELLAGFAGLLQAPMSRFAGLLNAMPTKLAQLTQALIEKGGAGVADESAPVAEEAPADEAPAEDAPAEEVVAEEAPADEAPAEDAPAEDAPAEEVVAEETDAAPAATDDAAEPESADSDDAAASDQTEEPATADSEETDDKED